MRESSAYQLILDEGERKGRKEGRQEGLQETLTKILVKRFGPLPAEMVSRIESTTDMDVLDTAILNAIQIANLEELQL